jgi:hypothetical protein
MGWSMASTKQVVIGIILAVLAGCTTAPRPVSPPPCDGIYFPDRGCIRDSRSGAITDRGHNDDLSTRTTEATR